MKFDDVIDRRGTFCTQWDYVKDRFGVDGLLPFTISDTDFALPEEVMVSLLERMRHPVFGYTRWNHCDFKMAVVNWYKSRFGTRVVGAWIVYSPSVMYAISQLISLNSHVGAGVVIQTPAYDAFFKCIEGNNRRLVENRLIYEEGTYTIDFADLARKLAEPENKILLFCSPHNPTGRVWRKWELQQVVELCQRYHVFIISDEIHMDLTRQQFTHHPMIEFAQEGVALVTSGSKTFNFPGLMYSYVLLPEQGLNAEFQRQLKEKDGLSSVSNLGMLATMQAYASCAGWVDELNAYVTQNIALVCDFFNRYFPALMINAPEATYLMWLDMSPLHMPMAEIQKRLVEKGRVAIMAGNTYGGNGGQFLRLNIGCPQQKLIDGLARIKMSLIDDVL
jgi:cystathionine beta-lyase